MIINTDEIYENEHFHSTPFNTSNHALNTSRPDPLYCDWIKSYCKKKTCYNCEFYSCGKIEKEMRTCPFDGEKCNIFSCKGCIRKVQCELPKPPKQKTVEERAHEILQDIINRDKK